MFKPFYGLNVPCDRSLERRNVRCCNPSAWALEGGLVGPAGEDQHKLASWNEDRWAGFNRCILTQSKRTKHQLMLEVTTSIGSCRCGLGDVDTPFSLI